MINGVSIKAGALADPKAAELDQLKAAAKQFEAIFTRQMLKSMRDSKLAEDDLFGSDATDQFREMQDSNFADEMASKDSLGIADLLVKQFQARVGKSAPVADAPSAADAAANTDSAS
ncbi:rod-binding protein [Sphingomonas sp. SRS2]|uniref:rod-binding protein n=1 Tax=Sphingomonas sp. SRS2 TaxID=133190 RepID=UPI0006184F5A|nr:rod-binding protein [Sphingomonas sp. SRS2]KKC25302.1 rod-binding protein [Sphingomonas sp. SRS2]